MGSGHISADEIYGDYEEPGDEGGERQPEREPAGNPERAKRAKAEAEKSKADKLYSEYIKIFIKKAKNHDKVEDNIEKAKIKTAKEHDKALLADAKSLNAVARSRSRMVSGALAAVQRTQAESIYSQVVPQVPSYKPKGFSGDPKEQSKWTKLGVTGSILLAVAIEKMVKQSKIVSMFLENISKALGLMIDLILLPFLPLLIWALMQLYSVILKLLPGKDSGTGTGDGSGGLGSVGGGAPGSSTGYQAANEFIKGLTGGLLDTTSMLELAGALVTGLALMIIPTTAGLPLLAIAIIAGLTAGVIAILAPYAGDLGNFIGGIVYSWGASVGKAITQIWAEWDKFWYDITHGSWAAFGDAVKLVKDGIDAFLSGLATITNPFGFIMGAILDFFGFTWLGDLFSNPFKYLMDAVYNFVMGGWLTSMIGGGTTNNNNTNNSTFNFNGLTLPGLEGTVKNIIRQMGAQHGS